MADFWIYCSPIWEALSDAVGAFQNQQKRLYYPYLLSALVLGLFWLRYSEGGTSWRQAFTTLFQKDIWLHPSTRVDAALLIVNSLVKVLLIGPYLLSYAAFAYVVVRWWEGLLGYQDAVLWSPMAINVTYSIVFLLVSDFSRFIWHYVMHRLPWLWEIHKVHHAAEVMTPLTLYRVHPLEYFWFRLRGVFIFGLVTGTFYYWFRTGMEPWSILHIHGGLFLFNLFGANLRHSHVPFSFGKYLERIFISPAQHQLHHSQAPEHHNKNMGSLFAFWDAWFGTLLISQPKQRLDFGIETEDQPHYQSFWQNVWTPVWRLLSWPRRWWLSRRTTLPADKPTRSTSSL